jgi:hypothetical protein
MLAHGPTCLKGPRSRKRSKWRETSAPQPGIRADLVARVRREIAEGTYDTQEKFEIALERLFARLERE